MGHGNLWSLLWLRGALLARSKPGVGSNLAADEQTVYSLTCTTVKLVAAETITEAGGVSVNNIADGTVNVGSRLGGGTSGAVYAQAVYNDDLIAGGAFLSAEGQTVNHVAR
jgi:hypothetical protein